MTLLHAEHLIDTVTIAGVTPVMQAASHRAAKAIDWLLQRGAGLNAADDHGWTALHYAASRDDADCGVRLLRAGASATLRSTTDETALDLARRFTTMPASAR
ncbi:MAG TPA: ankyrin repeat domain-containing protein [Kofleriaceae bacterium]